MTRAKQILGGAAIALLLACGPTLYTADRELANENIGSAIEVLEGLRAKRPDDLEVRMRLVDAYYRQARASLDAGDEAAYRRNLGLAHDELILAVGKWPESPRPHTWFGIISAYEGDLDSSLESFSNAMRLSKRLPPMQRNPVFYSNLAHIHVYKGQLGNARRLIELGRKRGAPVDEIERIEILAAWKAGDMVEARDVFETAAYLTPGFAETWDGAPLPEKMVEFEDFAATCCANPSCGPHMEGACRKMEQAVARRELDEETVREQLRLEMERRRELRKIYEKRGELEIKVEEPEDE